MAENSKWEYTDLEVEAAGKVDKANSGYSFSHIILKPHLQIIGEGERARAFELLQKAESLCLVSRALAVTPAFEPAAEVKKQHSDEKELVFATHS